MATLVSVTIGPVGCTYRSLIEFEALNLNLVALDQYYEVTMEDECMHSNGMNTTGFAGWTTDSTRYIHIRGKNGPSINKPWLQEHGYGMATLCTVNGNLGTYVVNISSIGVGGYIIFENLCFYNIIQNGAGVNCTQASAVTLDFRRCLFQSSAAGGATDTAIRVVGNSANVVKMHNCIINSSGNGVGQNVGCAIYAYNCTIYAKAGHGIQCGNNAATTIKNCYVHGGAASLYEYAPATITNVATSDAIGDIPNIPFDHTNFKSIATIYGSRELMTGSSLIATGASIVGQPAPFDYTTDFWGKSYNTATPEIGALVYDALESPKVITRHIITTGTGFIGDYATMNALEAANRDCVANDEAWTVHCSDFTDSTGVNFDGWNTDITRYLHIKGRDLNGGARYESTGAAINLVTGGYGLVAASSGSPLLTITNVGASGYIIFEGISIITSGNTAGTKTVSVAAANGSIFFKRCKISCSGNANVIAFTTEVGSGATVSLINCPVINIGNIITGGCLKVLGAPVKAYHCTFFEPTPNGTAVDMGNIAGSELVNCYSAVVGAGSAYTNLTGVTMVACASSDATGTPGKQNIAYNETTFFSLAGASNTIWPHLRVGSPLYGAGAILSSYPSPYNVSDDLEKTTRPLPPSVGCCDIPGEGMLTWSEQVGIPTAKARAIHTVCVDTSTDILYLGTDPQFGNVGEVFSITTPGAAFTLEYTHGASDNIGKLVRHTDGYIYGVTGSALRVIKQGAPWTQIATDYLGGAAGNPVGLYGLLSHSVDNLLYCGHTNNSILHSDADGVAPWTQVAQYISTERSGYSGVHGARHLWEHPTSHDIYFTAGYSLLASVRSGISGETQVFPDSVDTGNAIMFNDGIYVYNIRPDNPVIGVGSTTYSCYRALLTDMKFKRISIIPGFVDYLSGFITNGQMYIFGIGVSYKRAFYYSADQGYSWSLCPIGLVPSTSGVPWTSGQDGQIGAKWQGRMVLGTSQAGAITNGIWYSNIPEVKDNSKFFEVL